MNKSFTFKAGEEYKTAEQIVDAMMNFGLVEYSTDYNLELIVVKDFDIRWEENEDELDSKETI